MTRQYPTSDLGPQIADAIRAGIEAGGDPEHWDAPEFADARRLTEEAGCQWDFNGWDHALDSLNPLQEGGMMLGGVRFGNDVREPRRIETLWEVREVVLAVYAAEYHTYTTFRLLDEYFVRREGPNPLTDKISKEMACDHIIRTGASPLEAAEKLGVKLSDDLKYQVMQLHKRWGDELNESAACGGGSPYYARLHAAKMAWHDMLVVSCGRRVSRG